MSRKWYSPRSLAVSSLDFAGRTLPSNLWKRTLARRLDLPFSLSVASTDECNLACVHCVREVYPEEPVRKLKHMPFDTFRRLSDVFPYVLTVGLEDRGEPLMNPEIFRMVRHVKQVSNGTTEVQFNSNMMLLTREKAEELVDSGLDALQISLDGGTAEAFERIRIKGDFEKVVENSRMLQEVKRLKGSATPHLSMNVVAMRSNVETLPEVARIAASIGVESLGVNGVQPHTLRMRDEPLYHRDGPNAPREEHARFFQEAARIAGNAGIAFIPARMTPDPGLICQVALNSASITWDGYVHPCTFLAHDADIYNFGEKSHWPSLHFGNIQEQSLSEIWRSPRYVAFRKAIAAGKLPDYCEGCLVRQGCICHGIG